MVEKPVVPRPSSAVKVSIPRPDLPKKEPVKDEPPKNELIKMDAPKPEPPKQEPPKPEPPKQDLFSQVDKQIEMLSNQKPPKEEPIKPAPQKQQAPQPPKYTVPQYRVKMERVPPTKEAEILQQKQKLREWQQAAAQNSGKNDARLYKLMSEQYIAKEQCLKQKAETKIKAEEEIQKVLKEDRRIQGVMATTKQTVLQKNKEQKIKARQIENQDLDQTRIMSVVELEKQAYNTLTQMAREIEANDQKRAQEKLAVERKNQENIRMEWEAIEKNPRTRDQEMESELKNVPQKAEIVPFEQRFGLELFHRGLQPTAIKPVTSILRSPEQTVAQDWSARLPVAADPRANAAGSASKGSPSNQAVRPEPVFVLQVDLKAFLTYLNMMRSSPKIYSGIVQRKYIDLLDSLFCHKLTLRLYEEGKAALTEATKTLETIQPLAPLAFDAGLCVAAHIQAKRQAYERKVFGEDRSQQVLENVRRFVQLPEGAAIADCNLSTGSLNYEDILINLFASDGDVTRRNRIAMSKEGFSKCGFGVYQRSPKSPIFCTLLLADRNAQGKVGNIPKELLDDSGASKI